MVLYRVFEGVALLVSGCVFLLVMHFDDAGTGPTKEADAALGGTTSVLDSVSPSITVPLSVSETVAMMGLTFPLELHLVEAGTEPMSRADTVFSGATSALNGVWPATVLVFISEAMAMLLGPGLVHVLHLAGTGMEPTLEADAASRGMTSVLASVSSVTTALLSISRTVSMLGLASAQGLLVVDAGTEPTSESNTASGKTTSALARVSPVTTVVLSVSRTVPVLDLASAQGLPFVRVLLSGCLFSTSESNTASGGTTSAFGGVSPATKMSSPLSKTVAILDSGCSFVLRLPFDEAGIEPTSEADTASGGPTSEMARVRPATAVVFSVFE